MRNQLIEVPNVGELNPHAVSFIGKEDNINIMMCP